MSLQDSGSGGILVATEAEDARKQWEVGGGNEPFSGWWEFGRSD